MLQTITWNDTVSHICHMSQSQVMVTWSHVIEEQKIF